jgi:hypothetical protein
VLFLARLPRFIGALALRLVQVNIDQVASTLADGWNRLPVHSGGDFHFKFNHLVVDEESAGQRLDNFLMRLLKGVPKTHVYRIIRSARCA